MFLLHCWHALHIRISLYTEYYLAIYITKNITIRYVWTTCSFYESIYTGKIAVCILKYMYTFVYEVKLLFNMCVCAIRCMFSCASRIFLCLHRTNIQLVFLRFVLFQSHIWYGPVYNASTYNIKLLILINRGREMCILPFI